MYTVQKVASVSTAALRQLHCGDATAPGSTCATRAVSTTRSTDRTGRSSNPSDDW